MKNGNKIKSALAKTRDVPVSSHSRAFIDFFISIFSRNLNKSENNTEIKINTPKNIFHFELLPKFLIKML